MAREVSLNSKAKLDRAAPPDRLQRGALILLVIFWVIHLSIMLVRAEFNDQAGRETFVESLIRRSGFALFGACLCYLLYRCLRALRQRPFRQQALIGAAFALAIASIQAIGNATIFGGGADGRFIANLLYSAIYWFWFYFSWTTAYLAFSYSVAVQEQERHAAELAVKAQEAQVRALRYQINPHFLFNTLNAIAALVRDAPDKAEEMVVQLSDFFRRSLAINPLEDVTLAEEVDLQHLYLEIERTRFPARLRLDVMLGPGTADTLVPPLLLQPLVENAVKHGVARAETPTRILIRAEVDGPMLVIVVENDAAVDGQQSSGERVGLQNVVERLRSRFGGEASLASGEFAGGFRNTIRMPVRR